MPDTAQGTILTAEQAVGVVKAAGVSHDTYLPVEGVTIEIAGILYAILQLEMEWPGPTATSPDGTHIVYKLSQDEIAARKPQPGIMEQLTTIAIWGIVAYVGVNMLGFFKKGSQ